MQADRVVRTEVTQDMVVKILTTEALGVKADTTSSARTRAAELLGRV